MKTFISKLVIAGILSLTLVIVTSVFSHLSPLYQSYRAARVTQTQPGPEMLGSSYNEMMNSLFATSGR